jgi:hypothetical protein
LPVAAVELLFTVELLEAEAAGSRKTLKASGFVFSGANGPWTWR